MDPFEEFDVVFSFLKTDEELALQVGTLLERRVNAFVRPAQAHPEEVVNRLVGFHARVVTVFYRDQWGKSGASLAELKNHPLCPSTLRHPCSPARFRSKRNSL